MVIQQKINPQKIILLVLLMIFVVTFVSAVDTYKAGQQVDLIFTCTLNQQIPSASATYNVTIANQQNGTLLVNNEQAVALGNGIFNYNYTFPASGNYVIVSACYDGIYNNSNQEVVTVTPTGNALNLSDVAVQAFLLTFFLFLCFCFYMIKRQVNFDKWYTKVQNKYQTTNTPRAVLSSVGYFFVKESFMIYFLLFFPIIVIIINLITDYNLGSMDYLVNILMILYSIGIIIAGILMFGKFQEFVMARIEETKDFNWGISE